MPHRLRLAAYCSVLFLAIALLAGFAVACDDEAALGEDDVFGDTSGADAQDLGDTSGADAQDLGDTSGADAQDLVDTAGADAQDLGDADMPGADTSACDDTTLLGGGLNASQPVRAGTACDDLTLCADEGEQALLQAAFAGDMAGMDCGSGTTPCAHGDHCMIWGTVVLDDEQAATLCALSLASDDLTTCSLYGP